MCTQSVKRRTDPKTDRWLNLNAFAARLTAHKALDLSLYAIWAMREALEIPFDDIKEEVRVQKLLTAVIWIELCGEQLYSIDRIWKEDPVKGDPARGGPLYSGPKGFCKKRWELWRERFRLLSREKAVEGLVGKTRLRVVDAGQKIAKLLNAKTA